MHLRELKPGVVGGDGEVGQAPAMAAPKPSAAPCTRATTG